LTLRRSVEKKPQWNSKPTRRSSRKGINRKKLPDDKEWFGNRMVEKPDSFRIFLQNPNGIDTSENLGIFRLQLDEMRRYKIGMWLMPETNINRNDFLVKEKMTTAVQAHCDLGQIELTNTPGFPRDHTRQPGGVATIMRGDTMSRYAGSECDRMGRWIVSKFFGKNPF